MQPQLPGSVQSSVAQRELTTEERNWAMAAHLSALVAVAGLPFGHLIGPLVVYLAKGSQSPFVGQHARAALNYQLTISILAIVGIVVGVASFVGAIAQGAGASAHSQMAEQGVFAWLGVWVTLGVAAVALVILSIVFIVLGTVAASEGRPYRYPFAIHFLR